jgi:hypothetical protein
MPSSITGIKSGPGWQDYPALLGLGPLWFVVLLLIFSTGYLLFRILLNAGNKQHIQKEKQSLSLLTVFLFALGLAVVSYFWRMLIPIGKSIWDFPTPGYLPQYASFYIAGIILAKYKGFHSLPKGAGTAGFVIAFISLIILFPLAVSGSLFSLDLTPRFTNSMGKGHWQSAIYALWDSLFAIGISLGLITVSRRLANKSGKVSVFLSRHSYTVYIIHIPITVVMTILGKSLSLPAVVKTGLGSMIIIPLCFLGAFLVRKLPGLKKIL